MRIYFDIDPTLPNSLTEIKEFIIALSKVTEVPFALSFGYETLYAKRMEGGIEFNDEML